MLDVEARPAQSKGRTTIVCVDLDEDLVAAMQDADEPLDRWARELIVIELYRRDTISGGKAAELLGMPRLDFIRFSGQLGIPYGNMSAEDWAEELQTVNELLDHGVTPKKPWE